MASLISILFYILFQTMYLHKYNNHYKKELISDVENDKGKSLIIGSWNIKWFGKGKPGVHNYVEMSRIIEKMDVVALQELMRPNIQKELDSLRYYLKKDKFNFNYIISKPTGYDHNPDLRKKNYIESFGFIWNVNRIILLDAQKPITFVSDTIINNSMCRQVPAYADFKVKNGNGFDFRILTVHTVFNKNLNLVRKSEMEFVKAWMLNQLTNSKIKEKNIIVIGDFNANPEGQPSHFKHVFSNSADYRVLFEESSSIGEKTIRTTIQQKDNTEKDYFSLPVYDQVLVSNETSYSLPHNPMTKSGKDLGVVEFDQNSIWKGLNNWKEVVKRMSDHRPIWFRLDYYAEDKD